MPAKSISQQRLMGQAYAVKNGELDPNELDPQYRDEIVKLADEMTLQQLKDFAKTSHEGLPDRVEENVLLEDKIPGGIADGKTPEDIAKKHNVDIAKINAQIEKGIKVELEHTTDKEIAREIAIDHLMEFPDYYTQLAKMEKDAELEEGLSSAQYKTMIKILKNSGAKGYDLIKSLASGVSKSEDEVVSDLEKFGLISLTEMATPENTPGMGSISFPSTSGDVGSGDIIHDLNAGSTGTTASDIKESYFLTFNSFKAIR